MSSFIALLVIVTFSLLIVRLGTNALILTGMSVEAAKFQASSAFFGVGFTTSEAEMVMRKSVRRRIILHLIIAGNIGLTSAVSAIIVSAMSGSDDGGMSNMMKFLFTALGILALAFVMNLKWTKCCLDKIMCLTLQRAGVGRAVDYHLLLNVEQGYCISEVVLEDGHHFAGKALHETRPADHGVIVLGIEKIDGKYIGAPNKETYLQVGDTAIIYGHEESIAQF